MVTSRPTSERQSLAALTTMVTAPQVSPARNVMMATTAISERPAIELFGTMAVATRGPWPRIVVVSRSSHGSARAPLPRSIGSVVDMQPSLVQDQPARVVFVHQGDIVGGDDDGRAGFVELDEQAQQALAEIGIDVAGRLVGEQKLRPGDHRARDGGALLFAARQDRRKGVDTLAEPNPL